jgi:hypothetical protein
MAAQAEPATVRQLRLCCAQVEFSPQAIDIAVSLFERLTTPAPCPTGDHDSGAEHAAGWAAAAVCLASTLAPPRPANWRLDVSRLLKGLSVK